MPCRLFLIRWISFLLPFTFATTPFEAIVVFFFFFLPLWSNICSYLTCRKQTQLVFHLQLHLQMSQNLWRSHSIGTIAVSSSIFSSSSYQVICSVFNILILIRPILLIAGTVAIYLDLASVSNQRPTSALTVFPIHLLHELNSSLLAGVPLLCFALLCLSCPFTFLCRRWSMPHYDLLNNVLVLEGLKWLTFSCLIKIWA